MNYAFIHPPDKYLIFYCFGGKCVKNRFLFNINTMRLSSAFIFLYNRIITLKNLHHLTKEILFVSQINEYKRDTHISFLFLINWFPFFDELEVNESY